ncbi:hypothetical protein ACNVJQ_004955 [Vibrio harveyi]
MFGNYFAKRKIKKARLEWQEKYKYHHAPAFDELYNKMPYPQVLKDGYLSSDNFCEDLSKFLVAAGFRLLEPFGNEFKDNQEMLIFAGSQVREYAFECLVFAIDIMIEGEVSAMTKQACREVVAESMMLWFNSANLPTVIEFERGHKYGIQYENNNNGGCYKMVFEQISTPIYDAWAQAHSQD